MYLNDHDLDMSANLQASRANRPQQHGCDAEASCRQMTLTVQIQLHCLCRWDDSVAQTAGATLSSLRIGEARKSLAESNCCKGWKVARY